MLSQWARRRVSAGRETGWQAPAGRWADGEARLRAQGRSGGTGHCDGRGEVFSRWAGGRGGAAALAGRVESRVAARCHKVSQPVGRGAGSRRGGAMGGPWRSCLLTAVPTPVTGHCWRTRREGPLALPTTGPRRGPQRGGCRSARQDGEHDCVYHAGHQYVGARVLLEHRTCRPRSMRWRPRGGSACCSGRGSSPPRGSEQRVFGQRKNNSSKDN